jgi:hypothetical protein
VTREELIGQLNLLGEHLCSEGRIIGSDLIRQAVVELAAAPLRGSPVGEPQVMTETYGPCASCHGSGNVFAGANSSAVFNTCPRCHGSGREVTSRTLRADAPREKERE